MKMLEYISIHVGSALIYAAISLVVLALVMAIIHVIRDSYYN